MEQPYVQTKKNLSQLQQLAVAILCYYSSPPEKPNHEKCLKVLDSGCNVHRNQVSGQVTYTYPKHPLTEALVEKQIAPFF